MKKVITLSILIFSTLFSFLGQLFDGGNWLGGLSIILGIIGAFFGVWIGYKVGKYYF